MGEDEQMDRKALVFLRDGPFEWPRPRTSTSYLTALRSGCAAATQPIGPRTRMYSRGEKWPESMSGSLC